MNKDVKLIAEAYDNMDDDESSKAIGEMISIPIYVLLCRFHLKPLYNIHGGGEADYIMFPEKPSQIIFDAINETGKGYCVSVREASRELRDVWVYATSKQNLLNGIFSLPLSRYSIDQINTYIADTKTLDEFEVYNEFNRMHRAYLQSPLILGK